MGSTARCSKHGGVRDFLFYTHPDRSCGPRRLWYNWYRSVCCLLGVKRRSRRVDTHPNLHGVLQGDLYLYTEKLIKLSEWYFDRHNASRHRTNTALKANRRPTFPPSLPPISRTKTPPPPESSFKIMCCSEVCCYCNFLLAE